MTARLRKAALVSLRLLVVGSALVFVVRGVAWAQVGKTLKGASLAFLVAVVAVNACMMVVKAVRLQLLLTSTASLKTCLLAKLTASAINNIVPFRGGDVARLWMLERHAGIPKSAAVAVGVVVRAVRVGGALLGGRSDDSRAEMGSSPRPRPAGRVSRSDRGPEVRQRTFDGAAGGGGGSVRSVRATPRRGQTVARGDERPP